jgi:hypothetical protein
MLTKQASSLRVLDTGTDIQLTGRHGQRQFAKTAALISLVRDHGLREAQARLMLKEAAQARSRLRNAVTYKVKYASPYSVLQPGPGAPAFPEAQTGTEQIGRGSVPSIYPQEEFQPVDSMSSQMTDPSVYDPFYTPDPQAMQVAQQASQSGQKDVFDVSMVSGLLKSVRPDTKIDRYLGDLMKALDKLGRILMLFFWHQDDFQDRYGKAELPELEDGLRNAFETLGDIVLFLKEKTVQGSQGVQSSGAGPPDAGDPDIQDASRN